MITIDDVADLLSLVAANDRRTVGEADIELWFEVLSHHRITYSQAREAIVSHIVDRPGVWLEPGYVIAAVRRSRRAALREAGAGAAVQQALAAIPKDDPEYDQKVLALLRDPIEAIAAGRALQHPRPGDAPAPRRSDGRPFNTESARRSHAATHHDDRNPAQTGLAHTLAAGTYEPTLAPGRSPRR